MFMKRHNLIGWILTKFLSYDSIIIFEYVLISRKKNILSESTVNSPVYLIIHYFFDSWNYTIISKESYGKDIIDFWRINMRNRRYVKFEDDTDNVTVTPDYLIYYGHNPRKNVYIIMLQLIKITRMYEAFLHIWNWFCINFWSIRK